MPTNLYGPNDNYDLASSHVLPALIRKAHEAKQRGDSELVVWGSGKPMREFLYVDDLADACVFLMERDVTDGIYNVGTGQDVTIRELAETIMSVVGFDGRIVFDASKPDGTPRKLLDVGRLRDIGWQARTLLRESIALAYRDFMERQAGLIFFLISALSDLVPWLEMGWRSFQACQCTLSPVKSRSVNEQACQPHVSGIAPLQATKAHRGQSCYSTAGNGQGHGCQLREGQLLPSGLGAEGLGQNGQLPPQR